MNNSQGDERCEYMSIFDQIDMLRTAGAEL